MSTETAPTVIHSPSDVTVEFLRSALDLPSIISFATKRISAGQGGECHRINLAHSAGSGPATIILKIAPQDPRARSSGLALGIYEREIRFYNELAASLRSTVDCIPKCYYSVLDKTTAGFTLLLEDAGEDAIAGNDIVGATFEQARAALRELGRLHVGMTMDPDKVSWLIPDPPISQPLLKQLFAAFTTKYRERMDPHHYEVCNRFVASFGAFQTVLMRPGTCKMGIIHGDYRMDNLLFPRLRETSDDELRVMVVDWQLVVAKSVMTDVAYFLSSSLNVVDRRRWQNELLGVYCDAMTQLAGQTVMTMEACRMELRYTTFSVVLMNIVNSIVAGHAERGNVDDDMVLTLLARSCQMVIDLDSLVLLPPPQQDPIPLRPQPEDEKLHAPGQDKNWSESWYFDFVDESQGIAAWFRLGLLPNQTGSWYHGAVSFARGSIIIVRDYEAPTPDDTLHLRSHDIEATHNPFDPLKHFQITLLTTGQAFSNAADSWKEGVVGESSQVSVNLVYQTDGIPYKYRITTRYEIPCKVTGTITIDEQETVRLTGVPGQRNHSWGVRDWWAMDWTWSAFHLKNGLRVHAADLRLPDAPSMGIGYMQNGEEMQEVESMSCTERTNEDGLVETMEITIKACGGWQVEVSVVLRGHTPLKLVHEDGRVVMFERAWGQVSMGNGTKGVGWFEWNRNIKT